jgi:dihydroxyacetone kinase
MGVDATAIRAAVQRAADAMAQHEHALNAADSKIGDGDTGQTMRRVVAAVAGAAAPGDGLGPLFRAMSMAAAGATGSSLGTLVTLGLREIGKSLGDTAEAGTPELTGALEAAEATMLTRGEVSLGDKTAIDMLHALRTAWAGGEDPQEAARRTLDAFRDRPCQAGRAGRFSEKSVGLDDPGMLAFAMIADAIVADT